MTSAAMGAVPAPGTGSPESPAGRNGAAARTAEAGGHPLEIQMLQVGGQLLRVGRQAGSQRGATPLIPRFARRGWRANAGPTQKNDRRHP